MQKLDPVYKCGSWDDESLEHGEVFVTDDGGETDLDLGHYERFIDESLTRSSNAHWFHLSSRAGGRTPWGLPGPNGAGHPACDDEIKTVRFSASPPRWMW